MNDEDRWYGLDNGDLDGMAFQIGYQPLMRCHHQSGYELMFYKPYQGDFVNRNTNEKSKKCFCDECEWRYVPDVRKIGLQQAIPDYEIPNTGLLTTYSNSMDGLFNDKRWKA